MHGIQDGLPGRQHCFADTPVDRLRYLLVRVPEQLAGVGEVGLAGGLRPNIPELERANSQCQGFISGFVRLFCRLGPGVVEPSTQRPLVQSDASGSSDNVETRNLAVASLYAIEQLAEFCSAAVFGVE